MKENKSVKSIFREKIITYTPWIGVLFVAGLIIFTMTDWDRWRSGARYQETDNAYIKSDSAVLKSRMTGFISRIAAEDYQFVRKGELIAEINKKELLISRSIAKARLEKAVQQLKNLDGEVKEQDLLISRLKSRYDAAVVEVVQARRNPLLRKELISRGAITRQNYLDAESELQRLIKLQDAAKAEWQQAGQGRIQLAAQKKIRTAERDIAFADYEQSDTELSYATITAPFDGQLNKIKVTPGSLVTTGSEIVTITPLKAPYIIANMKETQMRNIDINQYVTIKVDAFPDRVFRGKVRDVAAQSSGETALLPADNSGGNFTKVVQRIPVYITLLPEQPGIMQLRPGMSVIVRVDTQRVIPSGD